MKAHAPAMTEERFRQGLLWVILIGFAVLSAGTLMLVRLQVAGADFSCFWAGAKAALTAPQKLYDFNYISTLQGWPLGPDRIRPYIYPPSALFVFIPFALPPYWVGYGLWVLATGGLYVVAGRKAGTPWWFILLPSVALVAYCGQVTFLIGGLTLLGLTLRGRPVVAGLLFGIAAAVKPQMLILLPIALIAMKDWKVMLWTGLTGAGLSLAAAGVWGVQSWLDWAAALGRFQHLIFNDPGLTEDAITPYAALTRFGLDGAWALLLAPFVVAAVWAVFRRPSDLADRLIVLLGGALLISPYAMNYELALLAPAVGLYLARRNHPAWLAFIVASMAYIAPLPLIGLLGVVALPIARILGERWAGPGFQNPALG
jgi:hypothetical protein